MAKILGSNMRIVFDSTSLHQSKRGAVTGVVHFDFEGDCQFPVAGWNDFVVVVAGWWFAALQEIDAHTGNVALRFMDGSYSITVIPSEGDTVLLRCVEDRSGAGVIAEYATGRRELAAEIRNLAASVFNACRERGIQSPDLERIRPVQANSRSK